MFRVSLDLSEFDAAADQTKREIRHQIARAVRTAAEAGRDEAKAVGPFKDRSKRLRTTIAAVEAVSRGDGAEAQIVAPAEYSSFVDGGTNPHPIYPQKQATFVGPLPRGQGRRAKSIWAGGKKAVRFLRFEIGGRGIFARKVNHPGGRPYPFMGPAYIKAEAVLVRVLEGLEERVARIWR